MKTKVKTPRGIVEADNPEAVRLEDIIERTGLERWIETGDPWLAERVALARGERLDIDVVKAKIRAPDCGPPPPEVLEWIAGDWKESQPRGRPRKKHRGRVERKAVELIATELVARLEAKGKGRQ